jgi:hypothetical protein
LAKKKKGPAVDPEYLKKQKASLVRKHRQVIYLNDSEMAAIDRFCEKFRVQAKASLYREAIMEKIYLLWKIIILLYFRLLSITTLSIRLGTEVRISYGMVPRV